MAFFTPAAQRNLAHLESNFGWAGKLVSAIRGRVALGYRMIEAGPKFSSKAAARLREVERTLDIEENQRRFEFESGEFQI